MKTGSTGLHKSFSTGGAYPSLAGWELIDPDEFFSNLRLWIQQPDGFDMPHFILGACQYREWIWLTDPANGKREMFSKAFYHWVRQFPNPDEDVPEE